MQGPERRVLPLAKAAASPSWPSSHAMRRETLAPTTEKTRAPLTAVAAKSHNTHINHCYTNVASIWDDHPVTCISFPPRSHVFLFLSTLGLCFSRRLRTGVKRKVDWPTVDWRFRARQLKVPQNSLKFTSKVLPGMSIPNHNTVCSEN